MTRTVGGVGAFMASRSSGGSIALALILLIAPLVALIALRAGVDSNLDAIEHEAEALIVQPRSVTYDDQRLALAEAQWSPGTAVLAPPWRGTLVTEIHAEPGTWVGDGSVVLSIDGVDRVAHVLEQPFWRQLSRGMSGPDVAALESLLQDLGFLDARYSDDYFGSTTVAAVREWGLSLGVPDGRGVFDPGWVIRLTSPLVLIEDIHVSVGSAPPAPGTPLIVGPSQLIGFTLLDERREAIALSSADDWVFQAGSVSVPVVGEGLSQGLRMPEARTLLQYTSLAGGALVEGRLRLADPILLLLVPPTAISTDANGSALCIWVEVPGGFQSQTVEVVTAQSGQVGVISGLSAEMGVLANPGEFLGDQQCP